MKILWLCNNNPLDLNKTGSGGWFSSLSKSIIDSNYSMCFVFPGRISDFSCLQPNINVYRFKYSVYKNPYKYSITIENQFFDILMKEKPDIIHIWGTEYAFSLSMTRAAVRAGLIEKVLVHIQGLCFSIANHLETGLPRIVIIGKTPKDFIIGSIKKQKKSFKKRGNNEIELLKTVKHVLGRTSWDYASTKIINNNLYYHYCPEMLRDSFYEQSWSISNCKRKTIFISQATYSLKGFHIFLNAFSLVVKRFPESIVYVAGKDITKMSSSTKGKLSISMYGIYIKKLIKKYNLTKNVIFLGSLNEKQMAEQYKMCNVFVLPSLMENSPNSLGEALMMGIPSIASYVGGIPDLIENGTTGYLYPSDDYYMLAYQIIDLFNNDELCVKFSTNGKKFAERFYDKKDIVNTLSNIYDEVNNLSINSEN